MLMQKNNKVMDIDAKLKAVALSDNKLGLLQGKSMLDIREAAEYFCRLLTASQ